MGIFLPSKDDLDGLLAVSLMVVERGQDVVCRVGVEVVLDGKFVLLQVRINQRIISVRS